MERLSTSLVVRIGIVDMRPFAGKELQLQSHRLDRQQQVGKNDGRVNVKHFNRLQA